MTPAEIATFLRSLDGVGGQRVLRFDDGQDFPAHAVVLPGSFNPPTDAHLALLALAPAGAAQAALLSTHNVDKEAGDAALADRIGMLLAIATVRPVAVLATGAARIVEQGRALRLAYPGTAFDFVMGYDTLVRLFEPRYYDDMEADLGELFRHHRVIAANRGDAGVAAVEQFLAGPSVAPFAARIGVRELDAVPAALSSTAARSEISAGRDAGAVPAEVAAYIHQHALYRQPRPGVRSKPTQR